MRSWGAEDIWSGQVLNLHINFSLASFTWKKIEPKGKGPCPRRRQCCCIVGDKIVLFGGTRLGGERGRERPKSVTSMGGIRARGSHA